jgi:hypothetical protein
MIHFAKYFKYHTSHSAILLAKTDCRVIFGTEKIKLKQSQNGCNHDDLAKAAFQNLLCWPEEQEVFLKKNEKITIEPFTAYVVSGKYEIKSDENIFFIS